MWSTSDACACRARRRPGRRGMRRGRLKIAGLLLLPAAVACLTPGCATEAESDLPWASPEPWEGTIPLPSRMMRE